MNHIRICTFSAALCMLLGGPAGAAPITYTIDPNLSVLGLAGTFQNLPFDPQTSEGMVDNYTGTLVGDLTGGTLSFSGGSTITGLENPDGAIFTPAGSGVSNYGVQIVGIPGQVGAYRDVVLNIPAGTVSNGAIPGAMTIAFSSGHLDYDGPATGPGSLDLVGAAGSNATASLATLLTVGGVETVTLPITVTMADNNGLVQVLTGQIVGNRAVPEPSTLALLGFGFIAMLLRRRFAKQA